ALPLDHPPLEEPRDLVHPDARERLHRAFEVRRARRQEEQRHAGWHGPRDALGELRAVDPDVERARDVALAVRPRVAQVDHALAALGRLPRLPRRVGARAAWEAAQRGADRNSTRLNSSHGSISYG